MGYNSFQGKYPLNRLPQKRAEVVPEPSPTKKNRRDAKHTYLQVGDRVFHSRFKSWGYGVVIEAWASDVPGGLCFVRIQFQDGRRRVFDNSFDSTCCCYYAGVTLLNRIELWSRSFNSCRHHTPFFFFRIFLRDGLTYDFIWPPDPFLIRIL